MQPLLVFQVFLTENRKPKTENGIIIVVRKRKMGDDFYLQEVKA